MKTTQVEGLRIGLELEREQVAAGRESRQHGVLTLEAPRYVPEQRAPLDLVACIDVSGSMSGRKIEEVRRAVRLLVSNLDDQDRLGLVTFCGTAALVSPLVATDREGRARLSDLVGGFQAAGGTNMSEGARLALEQLGGEPRRSDGREALRRALVFTDGHANHGLLEDDRSGWAGLFRASLGGGSVSWFGFGEDHDPHFLSALADETRGNAYVARDADAIGAAFAQELGSLVGTVAKDLRITLRAAGGRVAVLNDEKLEQDGDATLVLLPDLTSQERRQIVFLWPVPVGAPGGSQRLVEVDVRWLDVRTQALDSVSLTGHVTFVEAVREGEASKAVLEAAAQQRGANAQKLAAELLERGDRVRALSLLEDTFRFARSIGSPAGDALAGRLEALAREYADPAHYRQHRSALKSIQRTMSKGRSSGSRFDAEYTTDLQERFLREFEAKKAEPGSGAFGRPRRKPGRS